MPTPKAQQTRARNMARRKELILSSAREMIAEQGFDSLKIRELANHAGLTVPTIYNLIGGKSEILALIIEDLVRRLTDVQQSIEPGDPELAFEAQIEKFVELFFADEDYYRAAFTAGDRSGLFEQESATGIYAKSVKLPIRACEEARAKGLLKGTIPTETLGRQVYNCYRLARQDWTLGYIQLAEFRKQALTGIYLCLAADAVPEFRSQLIIKLKAL